MPSGATTNVVGSLSSPTIRSSNTSPGPRAVRGIGGARFTGRGVEPQPAASAARRTRTSERAPWSADLLRQPSPRSATFEVMTDELKVAFVDRLWALSSLTSSSPKRSPTRPRSSRRSTRSRRRRRAADAWVPLRLRGPRPGAVRVGRPRVAAAAPGRAGRRDADADHRLLAGRARRGAPRARRAPRARPGSRPNLLGSDAPFSSARVTEVVDVVGAGRLRLSFEAGSSAAPRFAPPG